MISRIFSCFAFLFACAGTVHAKAPEAPTKLKVKAVGSNAFQLKWKDNSDNETGWEIRVALAGGEPRFFKRIPTADLTSHIMLTNDLAGRAIVVQVLAYNGKEGKEKLSKPSNTAQATALPESTFERPDKLRAKAIDDGRIRLKWRDNSTSEEVYQVQVRSGKGAWTELALIDPGKKFNLVVPVGVPKAKYSFRVRAIKNGGQLATAFSKPATTRTKGFLAPRSLAAVKGGEGELSFRWKDRSFIEAGFELEQSVAGGPFTKLGDIGANAIRTEPLEGFLAGSYRFRMRAFRNVEGGRSYSAYSNVVTARPVPLAKPVQFAGTTTSSTEVKLTWKNGSKIATGYQIYMKSPGASDFSYLGYAPADDPVAEIQGLFPGSGYEFRVRSLFGFVASDFTPVVRLLTDGAAVTSGEPGPFSTVDDFEYQVTFTDFHALDSVAVTGLPPGLAYSAATRRITGVATAEGIWNVKIKATFFDGTVGEKSIVLRTVRRPAAPVAGAAFAPVVVAIAGEAQVPLAGRFSDPDVADARRVTTNVGNFDIILYPLATPATVANFLAYADAGRYLGSFFHRSVSNFVVQGGGFVHDAVDGFSSLVTDPAVVNEPGISNEEGTVAMAKLPGDPNSATSQFFASVKDNAEVLDDQNGGFTVFGRVAAPGLPVVKAINALKTGNYTLDVDGSDLPLQDVPMTQTPAPVAMDPDLLVRIQSVSTVPLLSYSATTLHPAVAGASVVGGNIVIEGISAGQTTVTVTATDLDGQTVSMEIPVTVTAP